MVIAIIGVLAAIVLAVSGSARSKGQDGAVRSNLNNSRAQADLFYTLNNGTYDGVCGLTATSTVGRMVNAAKTAYGGSVTAYADGTASTYNTEQCHDSASNWVAWVPLKASISGSPIAWCVDNTGTSKQVTSVLPASQYICP